MAKRDNGNGSTVVADVPVAPEVNNGDTVIDPATLQRNLKQAAAIGMVLLACRGECRNGKGEIKGKPYSSGNEALTKQFLSWAKLVNQVFAYLNGTEPRPGVRNAIVKRLRNEVGGMWSDDVAGSDLKAFTQWQERFLMEYDVAAATAANVVAIIQAPPAKGAGVTVDESFFA